MIDRSQNDYPQAELAERIRIALARAAITPSTLAKICGVTKQAVNGWLTTGRISKPHLLTIATLTNVPLEFFFEQERGSLPKTKRLWGKLSVIGKAATVLLLFSILSVSHHDANAFFSKDNALSVHYVKFAVAYILCITVWLFICLYGNVSKITYSDEYVRTGLPY